MWSVDPFSLINPYLRYLVSVRIRPPYVQAIEYRYSPGNSAPNHRMSY